MNNAASRRLAVLLAVVASAIVDPEGESARESGELSLRLGLAGT